MKEHLSKCPFHQINKITDFDALDTEARENPWPYYDWLRAEKERTIFKLKNEENFYMIHKYEDVKNIFSDTENFSNEIIPSAKIPFLALMDEPDHKRIREIVMHFFNPKNISLLEPEIQKIITDATENLFQKNTVELFETWADVIPLGILALLFGLDNTPGNIRKLHYNAIAINKAIFVTGGTGPRRNLKPTVKEKFFITLSLLKNVFRIIELWKLTGGKGIQELRSMFIIKNKNLKIPRPNFEHIPGAIKPMLELMLTFARAINSNSNHQENHSVIIMQKAIAKGEVTKTEMIMTGAFILFAGHETTTSVLSNSFMHLAENPKMFNELKNKPEKINDFIEEVLRFYTPVGRFLRRTKKEIVISGKTIPKDSIVILMAGAANTDPDKFEDGCAFNIDRINNKQNLSFGKGQHFCPGAFLARYQVDFALKVLTGKAISLHVIKNSPLKMVTDRDNGILRYEQLFVNVN